MRIAIMGAGSLGTITGALMTKGGYPADLVDTNRAHVDALNRQGARIVGQMDLCVPVHALTPEEMRGEYDLVFLLNKQTVNPQVLTGLLNHLGRDSVVCALQNGIPEPSVAAVIGAGRTVGGAVGFGATWIEPGVSRLTSPVSAMEKFAFEIGEIDGVARTRLETVQRCLASVGGTRIVNNLMDIRWTKLLINATFSGMSTVLGCTFGDVLDDPRALVCVVNIANETIRAAHAEEHRMTRMYGEDIEKFAFSSSQEIVGKLAMIRRIWDEHRALTASMLQDLEKGRDTEIAFINGMVRDTGGAHGLATPFNDRVVDLVNEAQSRRTVPEFSNIARFGQLLDACDGAVKAMGLAMAGPRALVER
jgi:2-dehydropantoate 2-reductase